jgi:hemerythrin-like domain-containing protein
MLKEHELGRSYIRGLLQGTTDYKTGNNKQAVAVIAENIRNYSDLLTRHIDKEDNILYPIAEKSFSAEQNDKLLQGFAEIEEKRVGTGKHEEFHQMLHRLQKIYL